MQKFSDRRRRETEKIKSKICDKNKLRKETQKAFKTKTPISADKISRLLRCRPNFIGCYAEDEIASLTIYSYPCYVIVNTDSQEMKGSHWIALGIYRSKIEIIDPLGFKIFKWSRIPCGLLKFLHLMSQTKTISVLKAIQSDSSILCGYFCILYIVQRYNVKKFQRQFSSNLARNDTILMKLF